MRKEIGGQEEVYMNEPASEILFKCRTNTLKLNDRKIFERESTECNLCSGENEDLEHFLLWCPGVVLFTKTDRNRPEKTRKTVV